MYQIPHLLIRDSSLKNNIYQVIPLIPLIHLPIHPSFIPLIPLIPRSHQPSNRLDIPLHHSHFDLCSAAALSAFKALPDTIAGSQNNNFQYNFCLFSGKTLEPQDPQ